MKTHQMVSVLIASLFFGAGLANAQSVSNDIVNGVKLRGDGSVDDTQPGAPVVTPGPVSGTPVVVIKRRGDGSIDDTQPGSPDNIGRNDSPAAKLAKIDAKRDKREVQRERALAGLAANDPKRIEINARFDRKQAQLDAKAARIEARGADDGGVRQEDRRADRREDRREDRADRAERSERAERAERAERPEKAERAEKVERSGRG